MIADGLVGAVVSVLERARTLGFLGPGPVEAHLEHAAAFAALLEADVEDGPYLDLGSGGGVPGLVLCCLLPRTRWVLLDAMAKRTSFLQDAVDRLGVESRVEVVRARAEEAGRDRARRGRHAVVVARSFGAPAVLAECAAPLLVTGGLVVVSEPPAVGPQRQPRPGRWPAEGLDTLGLALDRWVPGPPALVRLRSVEPCPARYPRPVGVPAKNPIW